MLRYLLLSTVLLFCVAESRSVSALPIEAMNDSLVAPIAEQLYFEAERQYQLHRYDAAYDLYVHCLEEDPESAAVLYRLATLNNVMRNDSLAITQLERAVALHPDNYWYKDMLVKTFYGNHQVDKALIVLEQMADQWHDKTDILMMLMDLYASMGDYQNMLHTLDKIELSEGKSEQLSVEKSRLYLQLGNREAAMNEMHALAAEYPNDLRYRVLIGDMLYEEGNKAEAFNTYQSVLACDSNDVMANISLSRYYDREGEEEKARLQRVKLAVCPEIDVQTRIQILRAIIMQDLEANGDSMKMVGMLDKALAAQPGDVELMELKARYMITRNVDSLLVRETCIGILEIEPENEFARKRLLYYNIMENDAPGIISVCRTAVDFGSDDPTYYIYLGMAYAQLDSLYSAVSALRKGIDKFAPFVFSMPSSEISGSADAQPIDEVADMYSYLGDIYHQLGSDRLCYQVYDSCLVLRPNDASVLNNYAYYLSLRKQDLKRAETMSRLSNKREPDNPTYLDTLAWVLYQQKRYAEAKEVMDKVVELLLPDKIREDSDIKIHIQKINKKAK